MARSPASVGLGFAGSPSGLQCAAYAHPMPALDTALLVCPGTAKPCKNKSMEAHTTVMQHLAQA
eukprot:5280958-Amphidinium_carterae.2